MQHIKRKDAKNATIEEEKMQKIISFISKYPLTTMLVAVIWVICIVPIPETPLSHVSMMDKWTHIVMYLVLSIVIAYERLRSKTKGQRLKLKSQRLKVEGQKPKTIIAKRLQSKQSTKTLRLLKKCQLLIYSLLLPSLMGGLLELVQAYCTGGTRSGDWIDFFADVLGCALGSFICILLAGCRAKGGRGCGASADCRSDRRRLLPFR